MTGIPILQTCFSRSWGGLELQALEMTAQLHRRAHTVWIACCAGSRLAREAEGLGLRVVTFDITGYFHPSAVWALSRFIRAHGIRIVHCQLSKDLSTVVPAADLSWLSPRVVLSKRVGSYLSKRDPFHRYTYAGVSRVLAISEVIHTNVLDTTPMNPDRVLTLHDAIDTERFSPAQADRRRVREEFGYTDDVVVVGFVGRFSPGKGHEELINAASAIGRARPHTRFLVVGEASAGEEEYAKGIRQLCRSMNLDGVVSFAGFRRDIADVMASFDVFAFPSHAESFGVVLIEAMAMERPVVSTNCDGVLDIVVDGETGLYVHPRDSAELATALTRLIDDPAMRVRLGKAGRQRVLRLFDRRIQMERLESIYQELLGADREGVT